jgi:hypothetical protein
MSLVGREKVDVGPAAPDTSTMYLLVSVYDDDSVMNMSDQIQVPLPVWEVMATDDDRPVFVMVEGNCVGRVVPGEVVGDTCVIPQWMCRRLGDLEWVSLEPVTLPTAGAITLRPRGEMATVEELSAALSGSDGPSWSCLTVGSELPLGCGVYDVTAITVDGVAVGSACILNCDVDLDVEVTTPPVTTPEPEPELVQPLEEIDFNQMIPMPGANRFPGVGRQLGRS